MVLLQLNHNNHNKHVDDINETLFYDIDHHQELRGLAIPIPSMQTYNTHQTIKTIQILTKHKTINQKQSNMSSK